MSNAAEINIAEGARRCPTKLEEYVKKWVAKTKKEGGLGADAIPPSSVSLRRNTSDAARKDNSDRNAHQQRALLVATSANTNTNKSDVGRVELASSTRGYLPSPLEMVFDMTGKYNSSNPNSNSAEGERRISTRRQKEEDAKEQKEKKKTSSPLTCMPVCSNHNNRKGTAILYHSKVTRHRRHAPQSDYDKLANIFSKRRVLLDALIEEIGSEMKRCCGGPTSSVSSSSLLFAAKKTSSPRGSRIMRQHQQRRNNVNLAATTTKSDNSDHCHQHTPIMNESSSLPGLRQAFPFLGALFANDASMYVVNNGNNSNNNNSSSNGYPSSFVASSADRNSSSSQTTASVSHENAANNTNSHDESGTNNNSGGELRQHHVVFTTDLTTHQQLVNTILWHFRRVRDTILSHQEASVRRCIRVVDGDDVEFERPERVERTWEHLLACGLPQMCGLKCYAPEEDPAVVLALEEEEKQIAIALAAAAAERNAALLTTVAQQELALGENNTNPAGGALGDIDGDNANSSGKSVTKSATHQHEENNEDDADDDDDDLAKLMMAAFDEIAEKGETAAVEEEASRSEKQQGHHKENDTIIAFPSSISKSTSSRHPLLQDMHAFKLAPAKTKVLQLVHDRDHIEMVDDVAVELGRARMAKIADVQRIITAAEKRIKELLLCDADETAESISDFIFRKILSSASNANNASLLGLLGNNSSATALTSSSSGPLSSSSASSGSTSMASIVPMTSLKPSAIYALRTELADFFRLVLLDAAEAVAKTLAPLDSQGTLPPPSSAMMPLPSLSSSPSSPFLSATTTTTITNAGGGVFGASSSVTSVLPEMQPFGITIGQDLYASDGTAQAARLAAGGVVHLALEICKPDSEAEVALDKQSIDDDENEDNNNNRKKSKKNKSNNNKNNLGIINGNPSDLRTVQNGFALVRPPGHHSGAERASGFCFFNNVAVAARAAQAQFPNRIKKVLIIDWDVHHGDGTEEIFSDDPNVMCFSVHQYGAKLGHVVRHRSSVAGKLAKKRAAAAADASKCLDRLDRDASGQRREFLKTEAARVLSDAVMTRHLSSPAHLPLSSIPSGIHTPHLAPLSSSPTLLVNAADPNVTFDGSAQNEDDNLAPCHRVTQFRRKKRQREVQEGKVEQREQHTAAETTTATDKKERVEEEEEENKRVSTEDKKETSGSKERGEVSGDLKKEKGAAVAVAIPSSSSLPTTASQPKELRTKEEEKEKENIITITVKKEVENASSAPNMNANVEPPSIHHEIKADNGSQPAVAAAPASQLSLAEELALINASGRRTRPKQQQQQQQVLSAAAIHGDNLAVDQQQQQVTAFTHKEKEGGEALAPQASTLVEEKEKEESHQQVRVEHEEDPLLAYFGSALKGADGSGKKKNNKNTNGAATGGPSSASESSSSSSGPSRSDLGSSSSSSSSESSSTSDDDDDNSDTTSSADQSAESTDSFLINADGGQNNIVINTRNDEEGSTPTPPLLLAEGAKMTITVPNTAVAAVAVTAAAPPLLTRVLLKDKREPKMNHSGWVSNTEDFDDYNYQGAMRTHGGGGGGGGAAMMMGRSMRGNGGASQSSFNPIQANGNRNATVFPGDGSGRGSNASEEDDLHTYNGSRSPSLSSVPSSLFLVCEDNEDDKDAAIDEKNENGKKRRRGRRLEESPDKNDEGKQMLRKKRDNRDGETPASKKRNGLSSSFGDPQLRLNPKYEGRLVPRLTEQGGSPHSRRSGGANAANTSSVTINESAFELDYCNGNGCTMFEGSGNNSDYLQKQREPPTARSSYHANLLPRRIENVHPSFWRFAQKREKQAAFYPGTGALDVVGNDAPSGRWLKVKQNGRKRSRHSGGSSGKRKGDAAMANKSNRTEHDIGLNDSDNEGSSDPNSSRSSSPSSSSSLSKSDGEDNTDDNDEAAVAAAPAAGLTVNAPWPCHGFGDIEYLQLFNSLLLPMMDEFEPDLVIVACGFDSAKEDNLGSMQMTPSGYYYLTRLLMKHFEARKLRWEEENKRKQSEQKISFVSSSSSTATKDDLPPVPRLVVALEGGYNLKNVALGSEAVLRALMEESSDGQKLHELESQRRAFEEWVGKRHQYNAKVRRMQERALRETERLLSAANNRRGKHVLREAVASSPNDENDNNVVHAAQNYIALPGTKAQLTEQNHPDREDPARERVTKKTRFEEALKVASLLPPPPEIPRELLVAGNGAQRGEGRVPSLFYTHFARNRMLSHQCRELVKKVQEAHAPYWRHLKQ